MAHSIRNRDMKGELRFMGVVVRTILPYYKDSTFFLFNRIIRTFLIGRKPRGLSCKRVSIQREDGSLMDIVIYGPKEKPQTAPGILWVHGGGYCIGAPDQDIKTIREFIDQSGCTVVAPYYTLATEKPYPAALEDCYLALTWLVANSTELGISNDQIMVAGSSAGGGLTEALCIYARDKGEISIAFQMPLYPMLDDRMLTASSQNNDAPVWNTKSNINAWKMYLKDLYQASDVPPYAAPGRLENFEGLPPAYTFVGSIEPFLDETLTFIERLKAAGVEASCDVYEGAYHGFDVLCSHSKVARLAHKNLLEHFRYACDNYRAKQN